MRPRAAASKLERVLREARRCTQCSTCLPHPPRPVLRAAPAARIVLIGQAPGARVHESGVPWHDESGRHLRAWLGVTEDDFTNPNRFTVLPMGFCWPGRRAGGDLPPREECAPLWHDRILAELHEVRLFLLIGQYAIDRYLAGGKKRNLTETVRCYAEYLPKMFPLPHPSWRSRIWMTRNPWFESEVLPELRRRVRSALHRTP